MPKVTSYRAFSNNFGLRRMAEMFIAGSWFRFMVSQMTVGGAVTAEVRTEWVVEVSVGVSVTAGVLVEEMVEGSVVVEVGDRLVPLLMSLVVSALCVFSESGGVLFGLSRSRRYFDGCRRAFNGVFVVQLELSLVVI